VVGETAGARGQARRARLRLGLAAAAAAGAAALACAYQGDPPGGPPRTTPPQLIATEPESGAVLTAPPHTVQLQFDEVLNERVAGTPPDIGGAVILSPATGPVNVGWHRSRLTVEPKGGFLPGRIYRVQLLPVLSDLRQNRMRVGHTIIFSTGPALPQAALSGSVVDWVGNRAAVGGLVEAVLLPDSLPYRTLADSTGAFSLEGVPPGDYLVYGVLDQNNNRKREPREAFDTMRVALQDSASVELYAFAHDTVGPRLRTAELVDSITVRVVFDRALDPSQTTDTSMVRVSPAEDSTQALPLLHVFTPAQFDSAGKAEAAERAARDTTQRQRAAPPVRLPAAPAPAAGARPGAPPPPLGAPAAQRRDSTRAMKMLARRPAPTDNRILRMASPLVPGSRYVVTVEGIRGLAGAIGGARSIPLVVPVLRPRRGAADTLPPKARGDTLPPGRPDSARARPDTLDSPAKPR
jgi:hypothetical protein